MQPESMVHALEQIHDLLKPDGNLIDIHPNGELNRFILLLDGQEYFIGYMQETDGYIEYRQASEAIETVVSKGLFRFLKMGGFEFRTYADSFDELQDFLEKTWSDAVITEEVIANARRLEEEYGKHRVFVCEQTRIGLLKKL
jgi:isochorismate hydrolase